MLSADLVRGWHSRTISNVPTLGPRQFHHPGDYRMRAVVRVTVPSGMAKDIEWVRTLCRKQGNLPSFSACNVWHVI